MTDRLLDRITGLLKKKNWYEMPRLLAMVRLGEIREDLREKNLHDTEDPLLKPRRPRARSSIPRSATAARPMVPTTICTTRRWDRSGRRFGRNVPLKYVVPDTANLMTPSPRVVSRELMTSDQFQPATILNLLAASWIQFQVHDWFVHKRSKTEFAEIPLAPGDNWGEPTMRVPRTEADPGPQGTKRPPAYANLNSHWWDCSQLYGCDAETAKKVRTMIGGKLKIEPTGLLPVDPADRHQHQRLHRQLVDRPGDAPHALYVGAQPRLRPARRTASELDRRSAVQQGAADHDGAGREDPHRRVDAGDPAASDHQDRR